MVGKRFVSELKRRNVFRMAGLYLAASWLIIEIASTLLPLFGVPEWFERALVLLLALGLVPALLFAWAYELTPDGLRRDGEVAPEQSIAPQTGRRMDRAIIAVLLMAVAYFAVDKFVLSKRAPAPSIATSTPQVSPTTSERAPAHATKSIAVLPLVNDSGDEDQQYFSDGLSEDLITALSRFDRLKVIGRNSSFQFRDGKTGSRSIGEQLGVSHLLEGSVRRIGEVVRITTTLVNAADGSAVWSERYDRPYDNLFALQDEITTAVATALQANLLEGAAGPTHDDRPPSGNLQAYEALLQANYRRRSNSKGDTLAAIGLLRKATELDPAYAHAWALLARALGSVWARYDIQDQPGGADAILAEARRASARAIDLAPDLPAALLARAYLGTITGADYAAVEHDVMRASELAPQDVGAMHDRAGVLATLGRMEEAFDVVERVISIDPLATNVLFNSGLFLMGAGRYTDAEARFRKVLELQPDAESAYAQLAVAQLKDDRPVEALESARREPDEFWRRWALALALHANGDRAGSDAELAWLVEHYSADGASQIAEIHAQRGEADEAFRWLDKAIDSGDPGVRELYQAQFLRRYQDDPRFDTALRRVGLPTRH